MTPRSSGSRIAAALADEGRMAKKIKENEVSRRDTVRCESGQRTPTPDGPTVVRDMVVLRYCLASLRNCRRYSRTVDAQ
jgi:hypothetical protein